MIEIFCINIKEKMQESVYNKLLSFISEEKKENKVKKFIHWEDAYRTLIADILVRTYVCREKGFVNKDISFRNNKFGKPILNRIDNLYFNIAHSGEWVVGVFDNFQIGIDIELIKPICFDIAKRFFSEEEYMDLMERQEHERLPYFYDLWTLKESYIKAVGEGLSIPLNLFTFKISKSSIYFKTDRDSKHYYFKQYNIDENYKLSVCVSNKMFSDKVSIKSINEIYEEIQNYV